MKIPALILCVIAAVITLIFAAQLISFYISPPDLSVPEGLDREAQLLWETHTALLGPAAYLAFGLIGLASVIAGMLGGTLGFFEKRLPLARGLIIAAAGLSFFIRLTPISFLYLAAAIAIPRDIQKAAEGLVRLTLSFILATFMFHWVTGSLFRETFLSHIGFENALLLAANSPSGTVYVLGTLLGAAVSGAAGIMLYRRRQALPAAALAVIAAGFILLFTPAAGAASWAPFVIFVFGLIALILKLRKSRRGEAKEV